MKKKARQDKFLWTIKDRHTLQLWPKADAETYLTKPFLPPKYVNTRKYPRIKSPAAAADWLGMRGIDYAAFSEHTKDYFCERVKKDFPSAMCTIAGEAELKTAGGSVRLRKGSVAALPTMSEYSLRVKDRWKVLWFHLDRRAWAGAFGEKISVCEAADFREIVLAAEMFAGEIYSKNPDSEILEGLAAAISALLRRSLAASAPAGAELLKSAAMRGRIRGAASAAAAKMNISKYELDMRSREAFGQTFARKAKAEKMKIARRLLAGGAAVKEAAAKCGYANAQSFSKAFSRFHNEPPSAFMKSSAAARSAKFPKLHSINRSRKL